MNAVAYYRVSTAKQGSSGLGLEAQQQSVRNYATSKNYQVVEECTEIETGTGKRNRPELTHALALAKKHNAVLLIAKLDRLARNVKFIAELLESKVKFVAVDMPEVDNLTIHILAAVAEKEAKLISTRTKDALSAAKSRGVKLGKPENLTTAAQLKGASIQKQNAANAYRPLMNYAGLLRQQGMSLQKIAERLNEDGYRTRQGKLWSGKQIERLLSHASTS